MKPAGRTLRFYWVTVALCGLLLAWWIYFFGNQADILIKRIERHGYPLEPDEVEAVRAATAETMRMFLFEGGFLALLLVASVMVVVRSLRRELEVNRLQRNFLSAVTHELRSPIAAARLSIESVRLGRAQGEKQERYLHNAQEDLDRLRDLVDQILDSARLSAGRLELATDAVDLTEHVRETLERSRRDPALANLQCELDGPDGVIVLADREALTKVVGNLLSNAAKYGGDDPRVELETYALDGYGVLEVRDHGPGFGGVDPTRLFEPFVRGGDEDVRRRTGVGLGLFLSHELVRAQGGRLTAREAEGGGARFLVELPIEEVRR